MEIVNFDLLKHPMNWVTVVLMVLIAGIALHLILNYQKSLTQKVNTPKQSLGE